MVRGKASWYNVAFVLCLVTASWSFAQDPPASLTVDVPPTIQLGQWVPIKLHGADGKAALVRVFHITSARDTDVSGREAIPNLLKLQPDLYAFTAPLTGDFAVEVIVADNQEFKVVEARFSITREPPIPPAPEPVPPGPQPPVVPPPFKSEEGLRVLIIEETAERATLPAGKVAALTGEKVRHWLTENTVRESDSAGYRVWDDDYTEEILAKVSPVWREAYAAALRDRKELPWVVAANKDKGYSGPLPDSEDDFLKILTELK